MRTSDFRKVLDPVWVAKRVILALSKIRAGLSVTYLRRRYRGRTVVVCGGHSGRAFDDNSRAFAEFLLEDPSYVVFWVYQLEEVRRAARAAGLRPLKRGAVKTEALIRLGHVAVFSHGDNDLSIFPLANVAGGVIVYLGHGVWGLKRVERRKDVERTRVFDLTIAASDAEAEIKAVALDVDASCIVRTGIPKHDRLLRRQMPATASQSRLVLVFPTWRDWLQYKPSRIAIDAYFQAVIDIVDAMPLYDGAGRKLKAIFVLHTNIRGLTAAARQRLDETGIRMVVSSEVDIGELILAADYLVSDYSAVIWDFLLQRKQVARFTYDRSVYDFLIGGYPSIERWLHPITCDDAAGVWRTLFTDQTDLFDQVAQNVLPYSDGNSCEKLAREIDRRVAALQRPGIGSAVSAETTPPATQGDAPY